MTSIVSRKLISISTRAWIWVLLVCLSPPSRADINSTDSCECKIEGCQLLSGKEFWNSEYSHANVNITTAPQKMKLIPDDEGHLNITWKAPRLSAEYLLGFRLEVFLLINNTLAEVVSYNLIINGKVQKSWFIDCIDVSELIAESKYHFWIKLQSLPFPESNLRTINYESADIVMPGGEKTRNGYDKVDGFHWRMGFTLTSFPTIHGESKINIDIPKQGDDSDLIFNQVSFTLCRCEQNRQECQNVSCEGTTEVINCFRNEGIFDCEAKMIKDGCYHVLMKVTDEGCQEGGACKKDTNCSRNCFRPRMKNVAVGKESCCLAVCLATDIPVITDSTDTRAPAVTVGHWMSGAPIESDKKNMTFVLPVAVMIPVTVMFAVLIITMAIFYHHRGKAPKVKPGILIVYSDDHTLHVDVLEKFVLFLQNQCQLHVTFFRFSSDAANKSKVDWCWEKVQCTRDIIYVSSEYAFLQRRVSAFNIRMEDKSPVTPEGGLAVETFPLLKRTSNGILKASQRIINVHFPYTKRRYIEKIDDSQVVYRLMDQLKDFSLYLHQLRTHNEADKRGIKIFDSNTYHLTPEGLALQTAISKAEDYEEREPYWCADKCTFDLSTLKMFESKYSVYKGSFLPPASVVSGGTSVSDIEKWMRMIDPSCFPYEEFDNSSDVPNSFTENLMPDTELIPPSDQVSETSLLDDCPSLDINPSSADEHIDSVSVYNYDSGLGSSRNPYFLLNSLESEHYEKNNIPQPVFPQCTGRNTSRYYDTNMANGGSTFPNFHSPESLSDNCSISDFEGFLANDDFDCIRGCDEENSQRGRGRNSSN